MLVIVNGPGCGGVVVGVGFLLPAGFGAALTFGADDGAVCEAVDAAGDAAGVSLATLGLDDTVTFGLASVFLLLLACSTDAVPPITPW